MTQPPDLFVYPWKTSWSWYLGIRHLQRSMPQGQSYFGSTGGLAVGFNVAADWCLRKHCPKDEGFMISYGCTKVGRHFYQGEILLWRKWLCLKASNKIIAVPFSHGYIVNSWNRWLCLLYNPQSAFSILVLAWTWLGLHCQTNCVPRHTSRCPPEAGPNSPGPRRLNGA